MKVLVLGGYGNFGARICRALCVDPAIELLVGGRSLARAAAFASSLASPSATTSAPTSVSAQGRPARGIAIDHTDANLAHTLRSLGVQLLIHTAGPFQEQGYRVAHAAAAAGAHYIDLADGRRFVCDFAQACNTTFQDAGLTAISGASTVPALSSAVVAHLCQGWQRIDSIDTCIAPAQTAPRGTATVAGVLSYCGAPLQVWNQGQWQTQSGWANPQRQTFARMRARWGALCDIPDLELFPAHFAVTQRVMFRAALEVRLSQYAFALLAQLRAWGVLPHPEKLASALNFAAPVLDLMGTALGGMVVRVQGLNAQGKATQSAWHIAADQNHGPEIPCMAAILLARRLASGAPMSAGAFACTGLLALAEFQPEFDRWGMVTDIETQ